MPQNENSTDADVAEKGLINADTTITAYQISEKSVSENTIESIADIRAVSKGDQKLWLNISGLANRELIDQICAHYEIHPVIIEDIANINQRPKVGIYESYIHIVMKLCQINPANNAITKRQLSFILMENVLITFLEEPTDIFNPVIRHLQAPATKLRSLELDYLLYHLMDSVVDDYFTVVDLKAEIIDQIEDDLIENPKTVSLDQIYITKRDLIRVRKVIAPTKDLINLLLKDDTTLIKQSSDAYFLELFNHCLRVLETIESDREMIANILDIYLSTINNKINETMRVLTIFATIFAPLTFIAGIYGMNFKNMPELSWHYGYYVVLGVMGVIIVGMLGFFRRKKWI